MNLIIKNDVEIEKAHEQFKKFTMNKKYRDIYESREKYKKDVATLIESAKLDGKKEGLEKGKKEGKLETAINMYYKGFGIKDILEITKVSKKDIEKAIKEKK